VASATDPLAGAVAPVPSPRLVVGAGGVSRHWTLRRFDLASVVRFSVVFYLAFLGVFLLAGIVLWALAGVTGLIGGVEGLIKSLFGFTSFHFQAGRVLLGALLIGVVLTLLGTLCNLVGAVVYNLVAGTVGGVRVTIAEEPTGGGVRGTPRPADPSRPVI
jgi:hypothetical protein